MAVTGEVEHEIQGPFVPGGQVAPWHSVKLYVYCSSCPCVGQLAMHWLIVVLIFWTHSDIGAELQTQCPELCALAGVGLLIAQATSKAANSSLKADFIICFPFLVQPRGTAVAPFGRRAAINCFWRSWVSSPTQVDCTFPLPLTIISVGVP